MAKNLDTLYRIKPPITGKNFGSISKFVFGNNKHARFRFLLLRKGDMKGKLIRGYTLNDTPIVIWGKRAIREYNGRHGESGRGEEGSN